VLREEDGGESQLDPHAAELAADLAASGTELTEGRAPSSGPSTIGGRVSLVDGGRPGSGRVFAWRVGLVPRAEDFLGARESGDSGPVRAAAIRPDGSFELGELDPRARYTLGAAVPGLALAERPSDVRPGRSDVELRLSYLLGLAITLEDARGGPARTSPAFFGRGPSATGPAPKLLETPPELAVLAIAGLDPGPGTRDRWQYLVLSERAVAELGPIQYRVQVPGYRPLEKGLYARPVLDRLHEERVVLEPVSEHWAEIAVEIVGAPHARDLGMRDDELIGSVRLVRGGDDPWELRIIRFAVHARALRAPESIGGLPCDDYEVVFEAEDGPYETDPAPLALTPGLHTLSFDASDSGLLLVDVRDGPLPYDRRLVLRNDHPFGGHFYSSFDRGPYVVPFLVPGTYRLTEIVAPGCVSLKEAERVFEVFPGQIKVEFASCEEEAAPESKR
jgi:hypothetical protein